MDQTLPQPRSALVSGYFDSSLFLGCSVIANVTVNSGQENGVLAKMSEFAEKAGGLLDANNGRLAIFSFSNRGAPEFLENISQEWELTRKSISTMEKGRSRINVRFEKR